jgi:hypothetical protein
LTRSLSLSFRVTTMSVFSFGRTTGYTTGRVSEALNT